MKKLGHHLKKALESLAVADAGEMLTRRQMARVLHGHGTHAPRRQVALWAGGTVSKATLDYALSTCGNLDADLAVIHPQGVDVSRVRKALNHGHASFISLSGHPDAALRKFLASHAQVAFLVLDGNDPVANAMAHRAGRLGIPLVAVTGVREEAPRQVPAHAMPAAA